MSVICELKIQNKKDATLVVANTILSPKSQRDVEFRTLIQLRDALSAESNGMIKIHTTVPNELRKQIKGADEADTIQRVETPTSSEQLNNEPVTPDETATNAPAVDVDADDEEEKGNNEPVTPDETSTQPVPVVDEEEEKKEKGNNEPVTNDKISRQDVIDFTVKDMRKYLKDNSIQIEGSSKMDARSLTNALLAELGFDELEEGEVD